MFHWSRLRIVSEESLQVWICLAAASSYKYVLCLSSLTLKNPVMCCVFIHWWFFSNSYPLNLLLKLIKRKALFLQGMLLTLNSLWLFRIQCGFGHLNSGHQNCWNPKLLLVNPVYWRYGSWYLGVIAKSWIFAIELNSSRVLHIDFIYSASDKW